MRVKSFTIASGQELRLATNALATRADLVFVFASPALSRDPTFIEAVREAFPGVCIAGCSTAGEISGNEVNDDTASVVSVAFDHSRVRSASRTIGDASESWQVGQELGVAMHGEDLRHVFVLSDGMNVNGTDLVRGMMAALPEGVAVTGGLAGDGPDFNQTYVFTDEGAASGVVSAVGFYGDRLRFAYGSQGGWDPFGPERVVTRSEGNILYELDHRSALDLYRQYLGEHAKGLPSAGLHFPLSVRSGDGQPPIVRTMVGFDEAAKSLTFVGDVPEGSFARLMTANNDRLSDGAMRAARSCLDDLNAAPELAILISCVGRKLVMRQRVEEEVEGVMDVFGGETCLTGFYSYGEIAPFDANGRCELHNQTMTITGISEV